MTGATPNVTLRRIPDCRLFCFDPSWRRRGGPDAYKPQARERKRALLDERRDRRARDTTDKREVISNEIDAWMLFQVYSTAWTFQQVVGTQLYSQVETARKYMHIR